jgi:hypothetical protein
MSVRGATGSRSFKLDPPCTPKGTLEVQTEMRGRDGVSSKGTTSNDNVEMTLSPVQIILSILISNARTLRRGSLPVKKSLSPLQHDVRTPV